MDSTDKKNKKSQIKSVEEREKEEILSKADEIKGEQLTITTEGDIVSRKELKDYALGNIENPERKFQVYYNGIQKLLRKHLPKGKEYKKARTYIYEEKNVYLTRGKRININGVRGADGRMGYITDADEILKIIMNWILSNGTMVELFNAIRDINVKKGYGSPKI